jgi:hypothetical protein
MVRSRLHGPVRYSIVEVHYETADNCGKAQFNVLREMR